MKNLGQVYNNVGIESDVMSASGHRLIQLMLDKCMQHIELSKTYILSHDIPKKAQSLAKAQDITDYLRLCLNHEDEKARKLSELLEALYVYLQKNLVQANIKNDISSLNEAKKILSNIKEGWDGIA
jgi:flagellar secretion chaperone FliS